MENEEYVMHTTKTIHPDGRVEEKTIKKRVQRAKQIVKNLAETTKQIVEKGFLPAEISEKRLNICKECDQFNGHICMMCGCFMKAKTRVAKAYCPMMPPKWGPIDEVPDEPLFKTPEQMQEEGYEMMDTDLKRMHLNPNIAKTVGNSVHRIAQN